MMMKQKRDPSSSSVAADRREVEITEGCPEPIASLSETIKILGSDTGLTGAWIEVQIPPRSTLLIEQTL